MKPATAGFQTRITSLASDQLVLNESQALKRISVGWRSMAVHPKPGVQERILLHLLDYTDFKNSVEVPFALSQMGIANAVAIARSNVPRAIAGLKDQGLLIERQAHVKGVSRKRKAYFLTDPGMNLSEETWRRLRSFPLRAILEDGQTVHSTLGDVNQKLPFSMRPVDIIRYMDDNCVLDARSTFCRTHRT